LVVFIAEPIEGIGAGLVIDDEDRAVAGAAQAEGDAAAMVAAEEDEAFEWRL
jgi:hypothetical protein